MNKKRVFLIFSFLLLGCLISCKVPNPLIGTWTDNAGSKLVLLPDNTFSAKIKNSYKETKDYAGTYNVISDVISFSTDTGYEIISEWDIRGAKLYFEWPDSKGETLQLRLYRQSR